MTPKIQLGATPRILLLLSFLLALYTCPHSKVEESFNLQATHDLFYHGIGPALDAHVTRGDGACPAVDDETCSTTTDLPYDHIRFPGVVPRTFFGAFILATLAKLLAYALPEQLFDLASHPMIVQFTIRLEVLLISWFAHVRLAHAVQGYFTRKLQSSSTSKAQHCQTMHSSIRNTIGSYYLLVTASQFHIPFYSGRLLPNTFALLLVTNAYAEWFQRNHRSAAAYLVFTTVIFRCDMLLLLFTVGLSMLIRRQLTIFEALCVGVSTGFVGLLMTVPLDSLLWGRPIWPEFEVWWFNTVDNRSGEWGEMVWHWYFSTALPKAMLFTIFLAPLAFLRIPEFVIRFVERPRIFEKDGRLIDTSLLEFFTPTLGFVAVYSFLPHKEIRFIFPSLPIFNVCSAYGMSRVHALAFPNRSERNHLKFRWVRVSMLTCGIAAISLTMSGSLIFLHISTKNYPGGMALERLKNHLEHTIQLTCDGSRDGSTRDPPNTEWKDVRLHIDVAAAMTGVSLYGQRDASIRRIGGELNTLYSEGPFHVVKSGYEVENSLNGGDGEVGARVFTHLLTERSSVDGYHVIDVMEGFPHLDIRNLRIVTHDSIYILEVNGWNKQCS